MLLGPDNQSIQISTNDTGKTFNALISQRYDVQSGSAPKVTTTPQMQLIQLTGLTLNPGEQLLLWTDTPIGQIGVSNAGAAKAFGVTVSVVDPTTGKTSASQNVAGSVAANADFLVTVPNWNQLNAAPATKQGALRALLPANFQAPTVH